MKTSKKRKKVKNLTRTVIFLLAVLSAFAFKASPVKFNLTIPKGKSQTLTLNFTGSKGSEAENLLIYPTDISMLRTGVLQFRRRPEFKHSAVSWVSFDEKKMRLIGTEKKQIEFEINVPRNATPGEYYVAIMSEPTEFTNVKSENKPFMLKMKSRVAIVIIINVPGRNYKKEGDVFESKVKKDDGKIQIVSTFENQGNIHLNVTGKATIRSKDGRINFGEVGLSKISGKPGKEQFVFPKNLIDFHGTLDKKLPRGEYVVDISFDYGYDFKKAKDKVFFSIERGAEIDESKMNFISVQPEKLQVGLAKGMFRTKLIEVSSVYSENMKVSVEIEGDWLKVSPSIMTLRPAQKRTVKAIIKVPDDFEKRLSGKITFNPEKGKSIEIPVEIMTDELLAEVKKKEAERKAEEKLEEPEKKVEEKRSAEKQEKISEKENSSETEKTKNVSEKEEDTLEKQKEVSQKVSEMQEKKVKDKDNDNNISFIIIAGILVSVLVFLLIVLLKKRRNRDEN